MNHRSLLGPIIIRFAFFAINLFFTIRLNTVAGWNFISLLLAFFATRDFVQGVRLVQVYYHIIKGKNERDDKNND